MTNLEKAKIFLGERCKAAGGAGLNQSQAGHHFKIDYIGTGALVRAEIEEEVEEMSIHEYIDHVFGKNYARPNFIQYTSELWDIYSRISDRIDT